MPNAHAVVDAAIIELDRLRHLLKRTKTKQVTSSKDKSLIKATCLSWFNRHRGPLRKVTGDDLLQDVDILYKELLRAADRATSRGRYQKTLVTLRTQLSDLRNYALMPGPINGNATPDVAPEFGALVSDQAMRDVLERRWEECAKCVRVGAPLAATVMMGGLLEALLLARVHRETNKSRVFSAIKAPRDRSTGNPLPLQDWSLRHYIDVAHELGWITSSAKDVGEVVRDYRNYVHPFKELSHGVQLNDGDAELFWEISKSITRQLLR